MYKPPNNGALACYNGKLTNQFNCVAMCKKGYDFVFNPPYLYFCSAGQWHFYALPNFPYSTQVPDCSIADPANPSKYKVHPEFSDFYFDGDDAKDPSVQTVIKNNCISLMRSRYVPPFFCKLYPHDCTEENVEVFAGALTV